MFLYSSVAIMLAALLFTPWRMVSYIYGVLFIAALVILVVQKIPLELNIQRPRLKDATFLAGFAVFCFLFLKVTGIPNPFGRESYADMVLLLFLAPAIEELFFRQAVLGSLLQRRFKKWAAIVASSLLFSGYHFIASFVNPDLLLFTAVQAVGAFFVGAYIGHIYWQCGSLYVALACHSIFNGTYLLAIKLFLPG